MAFSPTDKIPSDPLRSQDWNDHVHETIRLEVAKVNRSGDVITGDLTINGALNVSKSSPTPLLSLDTQGGASASLKCEHRGSNFIVRPADAGSSSAVIENTGGGALLINPSGGSIGIGTGSPDTNLTIQGAASAYLNLKTASNAQQILLGADAGGGIVSTMTNHDLQLRAGSNSTKMIVKANGNIGIGGEPQTKLHVYNGHIRVDSGELQCWGPLLLHADVDNTGDGEFHFYGTNSRELMTIAATGLATLNGRKPSPIDNNTNHLELARAKGEPAGKVIYLELFQDNTPGVYPCIRFHNSNQFWHRIEARENGFYFKDGNTSDDNTVPIFSSNKFFCINHPNKPGYDLLHSCLEGPEVSVFYRGTARLVNGKAVICLPDYFEALTRKEERTVLLTPRGCEPFLLSATDVANGCVEVHGTREDGEFYWEVKAVRADVAPLEAEVKKTTPARVNTITENLRRNSVRV